jgi:Flp pilus assembly protein TadG
VRRLRRQRGQTAVEFALCALTFFMIVFGLLQVAVIYGDYNALQHAVRDGARKGSVTRGTGDANSSSVSAAVTTAVRQSAGILDSSKMTITVTGLDSNASPDGTLWQAHDRVQVKVDYPWTLNILGVRVASGTMSSTTQAIIE